MDSLGEPAVVTRSSEDDAEDRGHVMCGPDARYAGSLRKPGRLGKRVPREPCGHFAYPQTCDPHRCIY